MKRYLKFIVPAAVLAGVLVVLMVNLSSALVYFNTPAEMVARDGGSSERLRLGGRVVPDSVVEGNGTVAFDVEDCNTSVSVVHTGAPPQLFQEGIGVVVEGSWTGTAFESDTMLVKHDEQYRTDSEDYDEAKHACSDA